MTTILNQSAKTEYLALVRAFPLLSIRDDEHCDEALAVIERLMLLPQPTEAEEAYLEALIDLVETYENAHVDIPPVSAERMLHYLMEENDLTVADLLASSEETSNIFNHWTLAVGSIGDDLRALSETDVHTALSGLMTGQGKPNLHDPAEKRVWIRLFATALGVAPDTIAALVD